jgi:hypothetical protein
MLFLRVVLTGLLIFLCFLYAISESADPPTSQQPSQIKKTPPAKQQQNKTNKNQPKGSNPQQQSAPTEIIIKGPVTVFNQPNPDQKDKDAEQKAQTTLNNRLQIATLVFAGLAGIAAVGAYFAARRQANAAEQSLINIKAEGVEQRSISLEALAETRKSADAAKDAAISTRIAADTAKDQLLASKDKERAWIMVKPQNPIGFPNATANFPFTFQFDWTAKNVGYTAGFLVKVRARVRLFDYPPPPIRPKFKQTEAFARFIIPPNGEHAGICKKKITAVDFQEIANGKKCIVFYGFIEYRHIFSPPDAEPRHTYFCSYWYSVKNGRSWRFEPVGPPDWVDYT